jgi:hypothetical protein
MNAATELRVWRRLVCILCFVFFGCSGCRTYLRTDERSAEELQQRNLEIQEVNEVLFTPGSMNYIK